MLKSKTIVLKSEIDLFKDKYIRILSLFFERPSESLHVNRIIKESKLSSPLAVSALKELEKLGILKKKKIVNSVNYTLNNEDPVCKKLKVFYFFNKPDFKKIINDLLDIPQIKQVIVYGSIAKGEYFEDSDLDICVIGVNIPDIDQEKYKKILKRKIQLIKFSFEEFEKLKEKDIAFYIELLRGVSFEKKL